MRAARAVSPAASEVDSGLLLRVGRDAELRRLALQGSNCVTPAASVGFISLRFHLPRERFDLFSGRRHMIRRANQHH